MSSGSLCSCCKLEVNTMQHSNHKCQDNLDTASHSFSQLSLRKDNLFDFHVDSETLYLIENQNNPSMPLQLNKNQIAQEQTLYSTEITNGDILKERLKSNLDSPHVKNLSSNRAMQPDLHDHYQENDDFHLRMESSSLEYHQNEETGGLAACLASPIEHFNSLSNKKTQTLRAEQAACKVMNPMDSNVYEPSKIPDLDIQQITELVASRKKQLRDLINSLYETSCYLDKIKNALVLKRSSTSLVKLAPTSASTKAVPYGNHFDFPVRSLFHKLPITIKSFNKQPTVKRPLITPTLKSRHNKMIIRSPRKLNKNNGKKTIADLFSAVNKENELKTVNSIRLRKKLADSASPGRNDKQHLALASDHNESMYGYNPLAIALRKAKISK